MKWIKRILAALVVLAVLLVVALYLLLGGSVKSGIETHGPKLTGTRVDVGGAGVNPITGAASISEFVVGNPEGYDSPFALRVGSASTKMEVSSLFGDVIHINEIVLRDAEINYELALLKSNIGVIEKAIEDAVGTSESKTRVIIDVFRIEAAKVNLVDAEETIELPLVEVKEVGVKSGGATAAEAAKQIVGPVVEAVVRAVSKEQGTFDRLKERGGNAIDSVKDVFR